MATLRPNDTPNPLRLWPGVLAVTLQWVVFFLLPVAVPEAGSFGVLGGLVGLLVVMVWWAFFSRAARSERWGAVVLMIAVLGVTSRQVDESIGTAGLGVAFFLFAAPFLSLAFVVWAVASHSLSQTPRRVAMVATILLASGVWTLIRSDGITGDGGFEMAWRWAETPEERLLARVGDEPALAPAPAPLKGAPEWPGFRGPGRDSVVPGVRIETDWSASPPAELWRRPIGPGVSSFAVGGDLLYTQEQRGDNEVVASYRLDTGEPVWRHSDRDRFWESHAGAGPRATPTLSDGRVYTLGATGILNVLDAADGTVVWSRRVTSDTDVKTPYWGFSGSPLVVDGVVVVAASGQLIGYDRTTGVPRWFGPRPGEGESYSSPHLLTIDGVQQVLLMNPAGAISVAPADGTVLWQHSWSGAPIVQPIQIANGDILLSTAGMSGALGVRRIAAMRKHGTWTTEERWTSNRLKPYFNDFVVHRGYAFGFDGSILACLELSTGSRRWKGGRYGHGQLFLLADQDLLMVLSEDGQLAIVAATPDRFTELSRFQALEGRAWNHPVLLKDILLVRNSEEMAAFRLSLAAD